MRILSPLGKDKRALSNMVAYVLLISLTIALSALVYNWLRFYVSESDINECPEGMNLVIQDYTCFSGPTGTPASGGHQDAAHSGPEAAGRRRTPDGMIPV